MAAVRVIVLVIAWLALLGPGERARASEPDRAAKIKSAYLLNFMRFARWPATAFTSPGAPLTLCVAGRDTLERHLDRTMRNQLVDGRSVEVRRFDAPVIAAGPCHLVFISESALPHAPQILRYYAESATLTVGATAAFVDLGTMLALNLEDDRIVFYANSDAIRTSAVQLSSKILQLARTVPTSGQAARN